MRRGYDENMLDLVEHVNIPMCQYVENAKNNKTQGSFDKLARFLSRFLTKKTDRP